MDIIKDLQEKKLNEYRPVLMWFWNDKIEESEIKKQLEEFYEQGIYEVFVHPMQGIEVEYLSERFFELISYAVNVAKELEMKFWIYDEYCWPSGTAGRKLLEYYPWTCGKKLVEYRLRVPSFIGVTHITEGQFIHAVLENGNEFEVVTDKVKVVKDGSICKVEYESESMCVTYIRMYFVEFQQTISASMKYGKGIKPISGYIDMLNPDAVDKFIEITHNNYKKHIGDEFGKTVKGVFDDEAIIMGSMDYSPYKNAFLWNDTFADEFRKRYSYDIVPECHLLFSSDKSERCISVKRDYWKFIREAFVNNYFGKLQKWCSENNLLFTGHLEGEEDLIEQFLYCGDPQQALSKMDIPGIDSIYSAIFIDTDKKFNLAGKLGASVAKFYNKHRLLCETFTGSKSDMRFNEMKRIVNKLTLLGANMLQYMAAYYSMDEARKGFPMCYQPSHGYGNPLFKHYKKLGDYIEKIQYLSAITTPNGNVLIIDPLIQLSQVYSYVDNTEAKKTDKLYEDVLNMLLDKNIEFDVVSEETLSAFEIKDSKLTYNKYVYDYVVVLGIDYCDNRVSDFLNKVNGTGTNIVYINSSMDTNVDDSTSMNAFLGDLDNVYVFNVEYTDIKDLYKKTFSVFGDSLITLNIEKDGRVLTGSRENDYMKLVFVANDEDKDNEISFAYVNGMNLYDFQTQKKMAYCVGSNNRIIVTLKPYQMIAVIIQNDLKNETNFIEKEKSIKLIETVSKFNFDNKNIFPLAYKYKFENSDIWFDAERQIDATQWLSGGGNTEKVVCEKSGACCFFKEGQKIDKNTRYTAKAKFVLREICSKLELFIEKKSLRKLMINNKVVDTDNKARVWGPNNCIVDISNMVVIGENEITIECITADYNMIYSIPFGYITGNFAVLNSESENEYLDKAPAEIGCGNIVEQGYPYYFGECVYGFTFETEQRNISIRIDTRDSYFLYVNGICAKEVLWDEGCIDISKFVKKGKNEVLIKLSIPLSNLMENKISCGVLTPIEILSN